jgi:pimeloyl-ACP methyl ester carboxylesterase
MVPDPAAATPRSRTIDLEGAVHYLDFGGEGPPLVLVHGLGGSHANWLAVGPALARHHRVLAPDLVGHGLTRALGRRATVGDNARLLGRFLAEVAGEAAVLVGNSMGGYLALAVAAGRPQAVGALVLVDAAQPPPLSAGLDGRVLAMFLGLCLPGVGAAMMRRRTRRPPAEGVRDILSLCCVDLGRIDAAVLAAHVALAEERRAWSAEVGRDFLAAARTLTAALAWRPGFRGLVRKVGAPALIVQGAADRLVHPDASRALHALRPDWPLALLDDVGHVPQLEAPERFLAVVEPWLAGLPRTR